ncbi:4-oxalocrotonate tautomerase family protein [Methylobacterium sp. 77]|uniref:tautomerase family protein n=1 Tax=Methylobacterium sp. 77 TaxID=1101192 RepID=UPI00037B816F|nr:4-oxalocrotonate tautomerase family protein [Methylobacterium sp. 77]
MPFVNVKIAGPGLAAEQVAILHREVTGLMADVLGKKAALTAVLIEDVAVGGWQVAGRPVTCAAHIDASVTAGTNSAEEKARFIAQANQLLHRVLGDELPLATYVVVTEIAADAWGYDGQTQAHRQVAR